MQNIIWERPDGGIDVTEIYVPPVEIKVSEKGEQYEVYPDVVTSEHEAKRLQSIGNIPTGYKAVAFDYELPKDKYFMGAWRWSKKGIEVDFATAKEVKKEYLRHAREQKFKDMGFANKLHPDIEKAFASEETRAELKRLRDITKKVDSIKDLVMLRNMTIED